MSDRSPVSRRAMLLAAIPGGAALVGLIATAGAMLLRPRPRNPGRTVRVCKLASMDIGAQVVLPELLVLRSHSGLRAIGMRCTHLGCGVTRHQDGFECPCHGSLFDDDGSPLRGPALEPLPWYEVRIDRGWVLVDLDRQVAPGNETRV